jgi:hypothetical protein
MAKPYYNVNIKINLKSKPMPISVTKPMPLKPDSNTEDNSPIDNFYHNQIRDLYDNVITRFRSGGYAVYNPRLLHYLTFDRFIDWVFENNTNLQIHKS